MCNKGGGWGGMGMVKTRKKQTLKSQNFMPKASRYHTEGREVWKSREKMEIIIAKFVYLKQTRIFASVIKKYLIV